MFFRPDILIEYIQLPIYRENACINYNENVPEVTPIRIYYDIQISNHLYIYSENIYTINVSQDCYGLIN